jgi:hypothetical protein
MGKTEKQLQGVLFCFEIFEKWNRMQFFFLFNEMQAKKFKRLMIRFLCFDIYIN